MTKLVDLSQVRSAWAHRYGSARATAMLAGSRGPVAAYDSRYGLRRYGRDASGMDPDDSDMGGGASGGGGDDPDSRMEAIKTFLKNRLDPESWSTLCKMMEFGGRRNRPSVNVQRRSRQLQRQRQQQRPAPRIRWSPFPGRPDGKGRP